MPSHFSHVRLFATLWTVARQAHLSMGFSRQEYWSGLPFPPLGDIPDLGIEPQSLMSPALAGEFFTSSATWEARNCIAEMLMNLPGVKQTKSGAISWKILPQSPIPHPKLAPAPNLGTPIRDQRAVHVMASVQLKPASFHFKGMKETFSSFKGTNPPLLQALIRIAAQVTLWRARTLSIPHPAPHPAVLIQNPGRSWSGSP